MATEGEIKWEGKVTAKLRGCRPDQIWPLLEDFFSIHKWLPLLETCHGVEGESGQPGCIRYCTAKPQFPDRSGERNKKWALEKLVEINLVDRSFSYELMENNIGFNSYMAKMKLLPLSGSEGEETEIVWSFVVNPVEGWTLEDLVSFYDSMLQGMAERMREAVQDAKQI